MKHKTAEALFKLLEVGLSRERIRQILKKHGISYKRDPKKMYPKQRWTPELLAQFKADYEARESVIELSEKYNIGLSRVCQILNYKLGIYCNQSYSFASDKTVKQYQGL